MEAYTEVDLEGVVELETFTEEVMEEYVEVGMGVSYTECLKEEEEEATVEGPASSWASPGHPRAPTKANHRWAGPG